MPDNYADYTTRINFFMGHNPHDLAARFGTPLYIYNEYVLRQRCRELVALSDYEGFHVSYSVKANSNPYLLRIIHEEGLLADAMSPGEIAMDFMAGYEPRELLYISNNNTADEMAHAIDKGLLVSVDSLSQLQLFGELGKSDRVMVRLNPGIGEGHHAKVITGGAASKFGVNPDDLGQMLDLMQKYNLTLAGLNQHIGSLFMHPDKYLEAARVLLDLVDHLPGPFFKQLDIVDFGGGFGIPYHKNENEERLDLQTLSNGLHTIMMNWLGDSGFQGHFVVEPGRYVVAECGLLLGEVTAIKNNGHKHFAGTNLGFNVLMRPMLYDAWHDIEIYGKPGANIPRAEKMRQTVVGNICESGDILAKDRILPPMLPGDLIGVLDAGAYGFSMASNYNERLLPAEILITEQGDIRLIRRRQTTADLEICLKDLDN